MDGWILLKEIGRVGSPLLLEIISMVDQERKFRWEEVRLLLMYQKLPHSPNPSFNLQWRVWRFLKKGTSTSSPWLISTT